MSSTRRVFPFVTLVGIIFIAAALATLVEQNQLPFFLLLFLIGLMGWIFWMGGGWRLADKDTVVIIEDFTRTAHLFEHGSYLYIPIVNAIAAKMPNYPIMHEFAVDAIDTKTTKILKIDEITVGVKYTITDFMICYEKSAGIKQLIKDLEHSEKLRTDNPTLWIRAINTMMQGLIDDAIRSAVWKWATLLAQNPNLQLETSFARSSPVEHDPYSLSLNRDKLSAKVMDEVRMRAQRWGLKVEYLAFENIVLDPELINRATRDKPRELANAEHDAKKEAIAIREKGMAEAEVRAATVAKVIEVMMNQERLPLTEQMIYNIVRAAMYSDGKMIWHGVVEKVSGETVKAA
jgi:hypothetical protein